MGRNSRVASIFGRLNMATASARAMSANLNHEECAPPVSVVRLERGADQQASR